MVPLIVLQWLLFCNLCVISYGCTGTWKENWRYSPIGRVNLCDYKDQTRGEIPINIRSDTEYLRLGKNELNNTAVNGSLIAQQVPDLAALDLGYNLLTQMPDLTMFASTLRYISVAGNEITKINLNQFSSFHSLIIIDLKSNGLTSYILTEIIPITNLYLDNNDLTIVDFNDFHLSPNLSSLSLNNNPVTKLIFPESPNQVALEFLYLDQIDSINSCIKIPHMTDLTHLSLGANSIEILELANFTNLPHLQSLGLLGNPVGSINSLNSGVTLPSLESIEIPYGGFEGTLNLTPLASQFLPTLEDINFGVQHIDSLTIDSGYVLENLRFLFLERTDFEVLDLNFFITATPILLKLSMWNCQITQVLTPKNNTAHPHLVYLYLEGNPITTLGDLCFPSYDNSFGWFGVYLDRTQLRCDGCMLWLVTCPGDLRHDNPPCSSPQAIAGLRINSVTHLLADTTCAGNAVEEGVFRRSTHNSNKEAAISVTSQHGEQDCARRTNAMGFQSFTYNEATNACEIYKEDGGEFVA